MDFFNEEHCLFRETLRYFINQEIAPHVEEWEEQRSIPVHEIFKKLGNEGFLGLTYSQEYGGLDLDCWYKIILGEELGYITAGGVAMAIVCQTDTCTPALSTYGSHELKKQFLEPGIFGNSVGAIAITEPTAGSDVLAIATTAIEDGDDYIINGSKSYITNGSVADFVVTCCRTPDSSGISGISLIIVPTKLPGFNVMKRYDKLGNLCCDHAELFYHDVRVPKKYTIGLPGMGYEMQMEQLQHERLMLSIIATSQARRLLTRAIRYSRERITFGKKLIDNQSIAFNLADLETDIEFLYQMVYHCAHKLMKGENIFREVAMVKLKSSKLLRQVADQAMQIFGGYGYMEDKEIIRGFRDSRAAAFAGGTDQIMQHILTKYLDHDDSKF